MSRTLCLDCQRPELSCICRFISPVANDIHVVVLQHPGEVSQTKGTIALLAKSLQSCNVIVGENFSDEPQLEKIFEDYQPLLLYPGEKASVIEQTLVNKLASQAQVNLSDKNDSKPPCIIILDGTWKKAYRMFMVSNNLQELPQICLPEHLANTGQYLIRKVAKKNALSSLEATCYALALLESGSDFNKITINNAGKYQVLLNNFQAFNQFQLSFRPAAHRERQSNTLRKPNAG